MRLALLIIGLLCGCTDSNASFKERAAGQRETIEIRAEQRASEQREDAQPDERKQQQRNEPAQTQARKAASEAKKAELAPHARTTPNGRDQIQLDDAAKKAAKGTAAAAVQSAPDPQRPLLCCDGTPSPSCTCSGSRRGCCSHHGGVCGCVD